jgi:hypothetical protein
MRALPVGDNPELVLRVVRKTLRSFGVSVEDIIGAAKDRETKLSATLAQDRASIEQLERHIAGRRANIERTSEQLSETRDVRELLQNALEVETKIGPLLSQQEVARLQAEAQARGLDAGAPGTVPQAGSPGAAGPPPTGVPAAADAKPAGASSKSQAPASKSAVPPPLPKRTAPPTSKKSVTPARPMAAPDASATASSKPEPVPSFVDPIDQLEPTTRTLPPSETLRKAKP